VRYRTVPLHLRRERSVGGDWISMSSAVLCRRATSGVSTRATRGRSPPASPSPLTSDAPDDSIGPSRLGPGEECATLNSKASIKPGVMTIEQGSG
jgi:hypothetical protein